MPHVIGCIRTIEQSRSLRAHHAGGHDRRAVPSSQSPSSSKMLSPPSDWKVYEPDIMGQADKLYKKPGYSPL